VPSACSAVCRSSSMRNALRTGTCEPSPAHLAADHRSSSICRLPQLTARCRHLPGLYIAQTHSRLSPRSEARLTHCILTIRPAAHRDAGGRRAGRRSTGNTAWHSVSAQWEVVSCNLAKWAMVELIALSSESDSDEEMDTLMLLYLTSKRQKSAWKSEYMKKRKTHGEFALTSEFCDKQFTNYVLPDGFDNLFFHFQRYLARRAQ